MPKDEPPKDERPEHKTRTSQPPTDDTETRLDHIRELSQNARTTWFGLLALLAFVTVTLMAHDDTKFFAAGVETELPLVGISVPTTAFFIAAPLLLAAVYAYLHLYLMALWDALAALPQEKGAPPISERVYPWLLTQAALWLRRVIRKDGASPRRALGMATALISFLITWIFGLLALGRLWTESFAYHEEYLTLWIATCLAAAGFIGVRSLFAMWRLMAGTQHARAHSFPPWLALTTTLALPLVAVWSWERTEGGAVIYRAAERNRIVIALFQTAESRNTADGVAALPTVLAEWGDGQSNDSDKIRRWHPLAPLSTANMLESELTQRPPDWRSWSNWMEDFEKEYRDRKGLTAAELRESGNTAEFETDAKERFADYIAKLEAPNLDGRDVRQAALWGAFIPGANFREANMQRAILFEAELQGADLTGAAMQEAILSKAQMQGADFSGAGMHSANLIGAEMQGAILRRAEMQESDASSAEMQGAILFGARMRAADFSGANMRGADLVSAEMQGADLSHAKLQGAVLRGAEMQAANLRGVKMQSAFLRNARMHAADLLGAEMQSAFCGATTLQGTALPNATVLCLGGAGGILREAIGNEHTRLPAGFSVRSCLPGPETALSDTLRDALDFLPADPKRIGGVIVRHSRETFLDLLLCDEGEVPVVFEGVWKAMGDGRWRSYVDGVIHAEGAAEDGGWGDIPVPWVTPPDAPPPEGRPLQ
ncbi:MAG: pentapeptide repeat-containing protein [Pseudomonadota bacterium]